MTYIATGDKPPEFLRNGRSEYAPPDHPDRHSELMLLAQALDEYRLNSLPRRKRIALLIAELPVHEAFQMAKEIVGKNKNDIGIEIDLMLQINEWSREVLGTTQDEGVSAELTGATE